MYAGERGGRRAIMRQSLNGDLTEEPLSLDTDELFDFGYSVDGRSLAITRGGWLLRHRVDKRTQYRISILRERLRRPM